MPHRGPTSLSEGILAARWVAVFMAALPLAGCGSPARIGPRRDAAASSAAAPGRLVPVVIAAPRPLRVGTFLASQSPEARRPAEGVRLVSGGDAGPALAPAPLPPERADETLTAEVGRMFAGYLQAFNRHDAAAAAGHWAATGENLNLDSGEVTRGREAVREVFAALFAADAEAAIDIDVGSIRPLRVDVALVDGVSRVSYADGEVAGSRFSAVVVRDQDRWQLASVREAGCPAPGRRTHPLEELAWLVGSWENVGAGVTASGQCAWSGDRAFLTRHHVVSSADPADAPASGDARIPALLASARGGRREVTEVIGWDPEREVIRSWIFSSDGRFAEGTWSRDDAGWMVRVEGRGVDAGREAVCTVSPEGANGLVVHVDGESLAGLLPPACGFSRTAR